MKKILAFCLIALLFNSCYFNEGLGKDIAYVTVAPQSWRQNGTQGNPNCFLFAEKIVPEIGPNVIQNGMVVAYVIINNVDVQLPYIRSYKDAVTQDLYTETLSCEIVNGKVTFVVESNDFHYTPSGNNAIYNKSLDFKLVIIQ